MKRLKYSKRAIACYVALRDITLLPWNKRLVWIFCRPPLFFFAERNLMIWGDGGWGAFQLDFKKELEMCL